MGGGKSGSAGTTYDYYGTIACGVSCGQTDELVGIILNGESAWPTGANAWPQGTGSFNVTADQLYVFDAQVWRAQQSFTVPANPANTDPTIPGNDNAYWLEYTFARTTETYDDFTITTNDDSYSGNIRFYWGTDAQVVDPNLTSAGNDSGDQHPSYAGISYCIPLDFLLGQQIQSAPNIEIIARRAPQQTVVTGDAAGIVDGQCNLAAWMAEVLTSENGIGLDPAQLDAASFNAVATYLQNNEALYGASPLIDTADTLRSVCDQFTQMIDGFIRFNPATKLIELGVYQHGVTPSSYMTLTEDSLTERPQLKSTSWQQTYSRATVRYNDRQLNFQQTSLHADDPRAWAVLKSVREISLDRPWITRAEQALLHGRETLRVVGHAQMTGTLTVRREIARNIRAGDYVLLDVDIEPNVQTIYQFFRVTKRTIPMTGPIKLEVQADNTLAPVPWNMVAAPALSSQAAAPPVENFRILEVPTVLSGSRGAIATLVQRPSNLIVGCQLYFDTDPDGTFQSLGNFTGFAAKGTLHSGVAASDTALTVDVDTTQPDADFFTQQFSDNEAASDTMLAFIVQKISDAGQPDDNQIAEDVNGYALVEICSVGAQTLVSAGQYQLAVLRGRQNTSALAFTSANSEVWLIPRANVATFTNALFATLRANRITGATPDYGQFRFCPSTFSAQLALSDATSEPFRFALASASAPTLTLTAPISLALNYSNPTFPLTIPVTGVWDDPDGNLVEIKIAIRKSTETADRLVFDKSFSPVFSVPFSIPVQLETTGNYIIKIIARDATNYVTEVDISVSVTGSGTATCAQPQVFDSTGAALFAATTTIYTFVSKWGWVAHTFSGNAAAFGPLLLQCSTPDSTIKFSTTGPQNQSGAIVAGLSNQIYDPGTNEPLHDFFQSGTPAALQVSYSLEVWASAPGMADSPHLSITMILVAL